MSLVGPSGGGTAGIELTGTDILADADLTAMTKFRGVVGTSLSKGQEDREGDGERDAGCGEHVV